MDINAAFPSKWIKASDLQGQDVVVTMGHVQVEEVGDDKKPVLYFAGKEKGMVLNKTNANTIGALYGDETAAWQGNRITLFPTQTDFGGEQKPCIRVRITAPAAEPAPPAKNDAPAGEDIPF